MYAKKKISIKKILKICGIVVGVIVLLVVLFFGFIMLTEFKPEERTTLTVEGNDEVSTDDLKKREWMPS